MTQEGGKGAFVDSKYKKIATIFVIIILFFDITIAHPLPVWASEAIQAAPQQLFRLDDNGDVVIKEDPDTVSIDESPSLVITIKKRADVPAAKIVSESKKKQVAVVATAYSSSVEETDSDPCTTANGFNVCKNNQENVIAANFLPFGTRVRFPDLYGERIFTVHDRMNSRYGKGRIDIWMKTKNSARTFGVKRMKMEIIEDQLAANM